MTLAILIIFALRNRKLICNKILSITYALF